MGNRKYNLLGFRIIIHKIWQIMKYYSIENFKFHHHICIIPNIWWVVSENNPIYNNNNGILSILCFFMSVCQTSGLLNTNTNLLISSLVSLICLLPVNPNSDAPKGLSLEHEPLDSMLCIYIRLIKKKQLTLFWITHPTRLLGALSKRDPHFWIVNLMHVRWYFFLIRLI